MGCMRRPLIFFVQLRKKKEADGILTPPYSTTTIWMIISEWCTKSRLDPGFMNYQEHFNPYEMGVSTKNLGE